jgi:HK97 family phage major capsid protein
LELLEDAREFLSFMETALAQAVALKLDYAMLRGSGAAEEPLGLANDDNVNTQAVSGAVTADDFLTAITTCWQNNAMPNAVVWPPRTAGAVLKLKDGNGDYLLAKMPEPFKNLKKLTSSQIPASGSDPTTLHLGDFTRLAFGLRSQLKIEVFGSGGYAHGKDAVAQKLRIIRLMMRGDTLIEQPTHFVNLTDITS